MKDELFVTLLSPWPYISDQACHFTNGSIVRSNQEDLLDLRQLFSYGCMTITKDQNHALINFVGQLSFF